MMTYFFETKQNEFRSMTAKKGYKAKILNINFGRPNMVIKTRSRTQQLNIEPESKQMLDP